MSYSDPFGLCIFGLPCPQGFVDAVAGFGDAASFGLAGFIRRHTAGGDGVNYTSGAYAGGAVAGVGVISALGGAVAAGADATAVGGEEAAETAPQVLESGTVWRSGKANPGNLTDPEGLSARSSLSNPVGSQANPVFRAGGHATPIDVAKLPRGSVVLDNVGADGHVTINAAADQIKAAAGKPVKIPEIH